MNMLKGIAAALGLAVCVSAAAHDWHSSRFHEAPRAVYTQTNAAAGNEILMFRRDSDGDLRLVQRVATRGTGADVDLGNQGALALSKDGRRLYAVNALSGDISVFAARSSGLTFIEKVPTGAHPISITINDNLLYALNLADPGLPATITGFYIGYDGRLKPIPSSTRRLSTTTPGPAQIEFHPSGDTLVVTERDINNLVLYDVDDDVPSEPYVYPSHGRTPFGFAFDRRGHLIVSEAFITVKNGSAMSSYDIDEASSPPEVISGSVPTHQTEACWVVITKDGRYAYTTNSPDGTISGYRIARSGHLKLLNANGVTASTGGPGSYPVDMAVSKDSRFLFSLNRGNGTLSSFRVRSDGKLVNVGLQSGLPTTVTGLVAH